MKIAHTGDWRLASENHWQLGLKKPQPYDSFLIDALTSSRTNRTAASSFMFEYGNKTTIYVVIFRLREALEDCGYITICLDFRFSPFLGTKQT